MVFLHIDTTNYKDNDEQLIKQLNKIISGNKNNKVFILYYMEGCGPCNQTRPEWTKIKTVLKELNNKDDVAVVDIDQVLSSKVKNIPEPSGFPTMRFITNNGKTIENYEDSDIETKDRTIDSFVDWIKSKTKNENQMGGSKRYTHKKRKHNKTTNRNQKGGIMIDIDDREAFEFFLKNSKINYLSKGSFGLTFILELNKNVDSPYKSINANSFGKPVTKLILKIGFFNDAKRDYNVEQNFSYGNPNAWFFNCWTSDIADFKEEVNKQTDIFLKSMNYLQPICPAIVYANNYNDYEAKNKDEKYMNLAKLLVTLMNISLPYDGKSGVNTKALFNTIFQRDFKNNKFSNLGVIAMEFGSEYYTLWQLENTSSVTDQQFTVYRLMCLYLLIRLVIETGYSHADFHKSNIMINPTCKNYFDNLEGCPLLIDFGFAVKIPPKILDEMKEQFKNKEYEKILNKLCYVRRSDDYDLTKSSQGIYSWACGNYDIETKSYYKKPTGVFEEKTNDNLMFLFKSREKAIDKVVKFYNKKHSEKPYLYPLLPLSNAAKNQMYNGIFEVRPYVSKVPIVQNNESKFFTNKPTNSDDSDKTATTIVTNDTNKSNSPATQEMFTIDTFGGRKHIKTRKNRKGGKWSLKYKKSINCKRPNGFSQKQYCKYGRNK